MNFICPITKQIMKDPVICEDGITYERDAVKNIKSILISNYLLKFLIEDHFNNYKLKPITILGNNTIKRLYSEINKLEKDIIKINKESNIKSIKKEDVVFDNIIFDKIESPSKSRFLGVIF